MKKTIRTALVGVIGLLLVLIATLLIRRSVRVPTPAPIAEVRPVAPEPRPTPAAPAENDKSAVRMRRAGAVTDIERGDYHSAIEALASIVRSGNGVGDEVELLKMAKDFEEKYRKPGAEAAGGGETGADEVDKQVVINPKPASTGPGRKAPSRPTFVARAPPAPPTGLLLVTSVPSGLQVEIDGKRSEFTPLRRLLDVGQHQIVIWRRDEPVYRKTVTVPKDGVATVDAELTGDSPSIDSKAPPLLDPEPFSSRTSTRSARTGVEKPSEAEDPDYFPPAAPAKKPKRALDTEIEF